MRLNEKLRRIEAIGLAAFGTAATLALLAVPTTQAQEAGADALLEEVVVTARRREESLQDVPVAISVLTGDFIQAATVLDHFDLYAETPGVEYEERRDRLGTSPTIRGVQQTAQNVLNQKMSVFIDGAPILGNAAPYRFGDLERIEVLRGPQSSAFGRATFSGAINFVTRDPGEEQNSTIKTTFSNQNRTILGLALDGPISDTLGYTLDVVSEEFDGPEEWIATDGVQTGSTATDYISAKLKYTPNDRFDMEINVSQLEHNDGPSNELLLPADAREACLNHVLANRVPYVAGEFNCQIDGLQPRRNHDLTTYFEPGSQDFYIAQSVSVIDPTARADRSRIQGEFNFSMDDGSLVQLIASYHEEEALRWHDGDMTDTAPRISMGAVARSTSNNMGSPRNRDETYFDIRWVSPGDAPLRWLAGASAYDFTHKDDTFLQIAALEYPELDLECKINDCEPFEPDRRQFNQTTATGVYGNITYDLSDVTTLSFEGRFQRDDRTTIEVVSGTVIEQVTDSFQPRLALTHALSDEWSVYAQLSSGTNPATSSPELADPGVRAAFYAAQDAGLISYNADDFVSSTEEELTNFEVGIKGNALDGRLQLAATAYAMDWKDMILGLGLDLTLRDDAWLAAYAPDGVSQGYDADGDAYSFNGVGFGEEDDFNPNTQINRGDADLKGLEFEATWRATDNWSFRSSLALQNNIYAENCDPESVDDFGQTPTHTVAEHGVIADCVDVSGRHIEEVSEVSGTLSGAYTGTIGSGWDWTARLGVRHQGPQFRDIANLMELAPQTLVNGQLSFANDNWDVILYGANLTDDDSVLDVQCGWRDRSLPGRGAAQANCRYRPRLPRELGLRLNYSF